MQEIENNEFYKPIRSAHETPTIDVPVGEIPTSLHENEVFIPVARVISSIGQLKVAQLIGPAVAPGSLLSDENHQPITRVIELFGPVEDPKILLNGDFQIGQLFFAVKSESVFPDPEIIEKQFKGTDASDKYDEPINKNSSSSDDEENIEKYTRL